MLKTKSTFFIELKKFGVIERNYSFTSRNFQTTINCNLYSCFNLLGDILAIEKNNKIKRFGKIILSRIERLSGASRFDIHEFRENAIFFICPF